jgi:hypothetical protein|tara:strand:- start:1998 stop:2906 length:909 start_codon:yes stop_codon:yes gene_type:complete
MRFFGFAVLLTVGLLVLGLGGGARAGEPVLGITVKGVPLPARLKTAWGSNDSCLDTQAVVRFFDKGMLWVTAEELRFFAFAELTPAQPQGQGRDALSMLFENSQIPWYLTWNEERVWITRPGEPGLDVAGQDSSDETEVLTFRDCPGNEAELRMFYGEGYALYDVLEPLQRACDAQPASNCAAAVFDWLDVSGDQRLAVAELARGLRGLLFLEVFEEKLVTREELNGALALALMAGPLAGPAVLAAMDYDGDGFLSFAELAQDRLSVVGGQGQEPELELRALIRELRRSVTELSDSAGLFLR